MASSKAISVELKAQQQAMLQRQLESGHYDSVEEVIGDALRAGCPRCGV
jgi:Arc/MetJ-type ribon-helix-helix transcriptional regulator